MEANTQESIECRMCCERKPVSAFAPVKSKTPAMRSGKTRCLSCVKEYMRQYGKSDKVKAYKAAYSADPVRAARYYAAKREASKRAGPIRARLYFIKHKYGLTANEYARMVAESGGHCSLCGGDPGKRGLVVDHDHSSGAVRGLLCEKCNHGLGNFRDDPERLSRAIEYLSRHSKK